MYENIELKSILIEVTSECNLKCKHCFNSFERENKNHSMPISNIRNIIEKCKKFNPEKIYFSGGEPLMHSDVDGIISLCSEYPEQNFVITTNGLLITDDLIKKFEVNKNLCIQISVDGITKEVYENQRGDNTFDAFFEILTKLSNSKIRFLTARTCVTRINYMQTAEIYECLIDKKISPSFLFVNKMGNAEKNWCDLSLDMSQKLFVLNTIHKLNKKHNYYVTPPEPVAVCNFTENVELKSLLIKYNGEVAPCQFFYDDSLGNIFVNEVDEILNYNKTKKYYKIAEDRKQRLRNTEQCSKCSINSTCSYGCLGLAIMKNDDFDGECYYRKLVASCYAADIIKPFEVTQH